MAKSYTKEKLWNWGVRFMHKEDDIFDYAVRAAMKDALTITNETFQAECKDTVAKWIIKKQVEIINNMKSPYREKLKKCKCYGVPVQNNTVPRRRNPNKGKLGDAFSYSLHSNRGYRKAKGEFGRCACAYSSRHGHGEGSHWQGPFRSEQ
jgi:hypothetical protein